MGAKLVGRWQSGAPLELNAGADPGRGHESNAFGYAGDADGFTVPRFAPMYIVPTGRNDLFKRVTTQIGSPRSSVRNA